MSNAAPDFNRANFVDGQDAYKSGDTVLDVIEHVVAEVGSGPAGAANALSFVAGFLDGVIADIRRASKPVTRTELHHVGAVLMPQRADRPEEKIR